MKFRLTYEGLLLSSGNRNPHAAHKHAIRSKLRPQLARLWKSNRALEEISRGHQVDLKSAHEKQLFESKQAGEKPYLELLGEAFPKFGTQWAPLVTERCGLTCSVEVLYLRPGARGGVMQSGDVDGRLKTLFDALAIPSSDAGLPGSLATDSPFFVLLEDDKLISHLSVTTDELLEPTLQGLSDGAEKNDARVVLTIDVKPLGASWFNFNFIGD